MSARTGGRWRTGTALRGALRGPGQPGTRFVGHHDVGVTLGATAAGIELRLVRSGARFLLNWPQLDRWFRWDGQGACWRLKCCLAGRCRRGAA